MRFSIGLLIFVSTLAACGGGGGGSSAVPVVTTTITPAATPTPTAAPVSIAVGAAPTTAPLGTVSGQSGSLSVPAASSGSGNATAQLLGTQPGGTPILQSSARLPRAIGTSQLTPILFVAFTPSVTLSFASTPSFTFTFPAGFALASGAQAYVALYDPTQPATGWQNVLGPGTVSGSPATGISIAFASVARSATFVAGQTYVFALFSTAATITVPTPTPSPSASPTPTSASPSPSPTGTSLAETGFACPASAGGSFVARGTSAGTADAVRRSARRHGRSSTTNLLAVSYDRSTAQSAARSIASHEAQLGATLVQAYDFPHTNVALRVIAVPTGQTANATAYLRGQAGVRSVAPAGGQRYASAVTTPYFPNDPYFDGFTSGPYLESAKVPGQWDMHAIGLEYAFGYSQSGNGSGIVNAGALGSSNVKIAIIDTGEDPTHPELASKIVSQHCFITGPNNYQSTSNFSTDPDGHGTDVSGIAAASLGNGFGFAGAGGNASIVAYRIFPTPDDNCANENTSDARCSADTRDIAAAIDDAVNNQHVNVISMSLGGGSCSSGVDQDATEGAAVSEAIAAGVIVVAAAGNDGTSPLEAPACDTGVIAVGATSLADGQANGTGNSNGSSGAPIEYVASYSNYAVPGANLHSSSAWGIVAPGGDPNGDGDNDNLHWIENIWTSTPFQSSPSDTNFSGECTDDYPASTGLVAPVDCRTLIAGTSMATPHVAGAVALILSATGGSGSPYQSPAAMKQLLCQNAHDIGDPHQGCGRLNVYRALATALGDTALPPL